ncbi:MAG: type II toxin-antitoxin system VapC family toxin [Anaerolineae bacterium]
MVVDTSAILALVLGEPAAPWVAEQLALHAPALRMSTVNLTETLIRLRDLQPTLFDALEERLLGSGIRFVPPDAAQARIAASARLRFPLNLGDCFAYALAVVEGVSVLTLDADFAKADCAVVGPPSTGGA